MSEGVPDDSLHWGSMREDVLAPIVGEAAAMQKSNISILEVPPLHQPCSSHHRNSKIKLSKRTSKWLKCPVDSQGQNFMLQSIELQHYKRRIRYMLTAGQAQQSEMSKGSGTELPALPSPPPTPKKFCSSDGHLSFAHRSSFLSQEYDAEDVRSPFAENCPAEECPVSIDNLSARQLLVKAVAAICAHSGFECASESALHTLTDIIVEQMQKLCRLINSSINGQRGISEEVGMLDHILKECGQKGVLGLQDYWNTRVRQVALDLEREDLLLLEEYSKLKEGSAKVSAKDDKT